MKYSPQRAEAICELVTPAQGENLAAVFTENMSARMIDTLRESTVAALREQAVAGGTMKDLNRDMSERWAKALGSVNPVFTDAGGHEWDTARYFQMNVRTNTMRVYNDCLVDDVARETGSDLMRISTGGDPDCDCFAWEGCIISVTGKTKGFPTYEDARTGGCFHPNCTHTLEYVDEAADAEEIALQKAHPVESEEAASDPDAQDERRYEIDQARKMRDDGLTKEQARVEVDRDNLESAIRNGLVRGDAREIVSKLTDAQVTALCPNGNPPSFVPFKPTKKELRDGAKETWNHGKRGGVVHIRRDAGVEHIAEVTGTTEKHIVFDKAKKIETAGASDGTPLTLSPIGKSTVAEIKSVCGVVPTTLTPTVGGNEIQHTFNRHGVKRTVDGKTYGEKNKKQSPITAKDIAMIPQILKSHDSVEAGSITNWDSLPSVKFVKTMADGTTYTVFAVAETLSYKTMWKKKQRNR